MNDLTRLDPTGRFSGLAETYARHRPDYPEAALDLILAQVAWDGGEGEPPLLVDVGSGTGISARQFARRGVRVIGVEPNEAMRQKAEREPIADFPPPEYRPGTAEDTGLPAGAADLVVAAQAFHWFDPERALAEFARILRPGGVVALMWNERDEADAFTAAYGVVMRTGPDAPLLEGGRVRAGEMLGDNPLFAGYRREEFSHGQELDEEGVLGRAFSASYAPREPEAAARFADRLRDAFARHQRDGRVVLRYRTTVHLALRKEVR
jgi:SAM-dependent methyltransferase